MHHDIPTWFLVLSLFVPRITLYIAYCTDSIPWNNIPFWGDFFMAIFIPRVLVCIYIADNLGVSSGWFILHLIVTILVYLNGGKISTERS